jgi:hypothetical protein
MTPPFDSIQCPTATRGATRRDKLGVALYIACSLTQTCPKEGLMISILTAEMGDSSMGDADEDALERSSVTSGASVGYGK